jgi:hypothetical protein
MHAAGENLGQARARIEAAWEALHQALDGRDSPEIRQAMDRLERLADQMARVERVVQGQAAVSA